MAAYSTSQASAIRPACSVARFSLLRFWPIFITTSASVEAMRAVSAASRSVAGTTVITSSPQVIGVPVADHAADMPVMPGTTVTGTWGRRRV